RSVSEEILRAQLLLELCVGLAHLLLAVDEVRGAAGLRGERLHHAAASEAGNAADADADEVERHARGAGVGEEVVVRHARRRVLAVGEDDQRLPPLLAAEAIEPGYDRVVERR